jgi:hypothetical protein
LNAGLDSWSIDENYEKKQKAYISMTETTSSIRIFYVVYDSKELDFHNLTTL